MIQSMHDLRELSYAQCRAALDLATVGRVALCAPDGPHIFPVNFVVLDESIILRTTAFSFLGTHGRDATIAFEVDQVDETARKAGVFKPGAVRFPSMTRWNASGSVRSLNRCRGSADRATCTCEWRG